jgi:type II secretory pathway component GspD/PulD (secretin)
MKHIFIVLCLLVISLTSAHAEVSYSKKNKTLSVTSEGQDLEGLLYEIMEETGIHMEIAEGVEGTVYDDFHALSIEDGLKRILKTQNFSFVYNDGSIQKIYVFPGGTTDTSETAPYSSIIKPVPRIK